MILTDKSQLPMPTAYQKILQKTFDKRIPLSAHIELTYRCNLSCIHCYATDRSLPNEMTTDEIRNVLHHLHDMGCLFLTFTGGEIFCRNDTLALLKYARQLGFAIHAFTNGTLLTNEMINQLADIELLSVEMSLYATDHTVHDAITQKPGSCAKTMTALTACAEKGLNVKVKTILMTYNIDQFESISQFAVNIGASHVFDFVLVPADNGSRPMEKYGLSQKMIEQFIAARRNPDQSVPEAPCGSAPLCGAGSNTLCITPTGNVLPCLAIRKPVGNIRNNTINEIWESPALDEIRSLRYYDLEQCRGCKYAKYCTRCPGVALAECGKLTAKSPSACMVAAAIYSVANEYDKGSK
ncbi:MAG: radical SAM protein [Lentisphaerae bacterium]|nr:radical SAM protein [Lentisphaerota bacterium]